ncbi:hypothetical protein BCR36DRAFT_415963 [Piromyces finnis]|uniref:Uncharacterized protein n=1 Tax=Piromyces finnis TaxID=1754191 RepID=A0A1Y1UY70_9FUNG|nr:hypothetical protein BCR36DRAFT_415963 [Piromyces finnis]|eukprot:ORX42705.1 hypothetical protein BCR36DRAFT_415963 [Piromyces finnis]
MTLNKCFAIDYSGSTGNDTFYHSNVLSILKAKFNEGDEIIIWDTESKFVTWDEYMEINSTKDGNGGTDPKCLFNSVFSKHQKATYSEFILISDGMVCNHEVDLLDETIKRHADDFKCNYTEVYLLGNNANLSIACPFTRFNASKTIVKNLNSEDQIIAVSDEDLKTIDQIDSINTMEEFDLKYPSLEKAFIARYLGTDGDKELRRSVLLMQKRINSNNAKKEENKNERIDTLVMQDKNYEEAKTEVIKCFTSVLSSDFQSKINSLIRMSDGGLKQVFNINKLQTFRAFTANTTEVTEVEDIQNLNIESSVGTSQWECPISIDYETDPMILITVDNNEEQRPVLFGFDKKMTEYMLNCPLNALYVDEFVTKFKAYIDHSISLKNYRASLQSSNPIVKSPFTRRTIIGAIPLGENDEHVKSANWSLMKIITGGKHLGDIHLWFFVLYRLIKTNQIPYLKDIEPFIEAQVKYRFSHFTTSISLSGLSNLPQARVFYPTAAWTCLISPFLIPKIPSNLNLLYTHLSHYKDLLQILALYAIELPNEFQPFVHRLEILAHLLSYFKKNPKLLDVYKNGLQNATLFINVDENSPMSSGGVCGDLFIPIDGEIKDENRMRCVQSLSTVCYNAVQDGRISLDELAWLIDFVDVQKSLTDINIMPLIQGKPSGSDNATSAIHDFWKEWDANIDKFNVKISENTCRPYYYVKEGVTWLEELSTILDTTRPILSLDKHFGNFVDTYGRYPSRNEYILYLYRKICLGSKTSTTLPRNILKFTDQVFARFNPIMNKYTLETFIRIFQDNASINTRINNEK